MTEKKKVTLSKDGISYTLTDEIQISAFVNSGFEVVTKGNKKGAGDDESNSQRASKTKTDA